MVAASEETKPVLDFWTCMRCNSWLPGSARRMARHLRSSSLSQFDFMISFTINLIRTSPVPKDNVDPGTCWTSWFFNAEKLYLNYFNWPHVDPSTSSKILVNGICRSTMKRLTGLFWEKTLASRVFFGQPWLSVARSEILCAAKFQ